MAMEEEMSVWHDENENRAHGRGAQKRENIFSLRYGEKQMANNVMFYGKASSKSARIGIWRRAKANKNNEIFFKSHRMRKEEETKNLWAYGKSHGEAQKDNVIVNGENLWRAHGAHLYHERRAREKAASAIVMAA